MTTRLEATVDLNLTQARIQLDRFENDLRQLRTPIDVQVEVTGEQQIAEVRREIDRASGVVDVDLDTADLTRGEQAVRDINQQLQLAQDELRQAQSRADALGDELQRTGRVGSGAFASLRQSIVPLVATFAAGLGIREVVQQFNEAVTAASNLEQSIGGVQAIFGSSADEVLGFAQAAAQAVGLSEDAANQLGSRLGAQLQSFGFDVDESARKTTELITLGADLAATFGGPVSDAVEAVGSLLRGETNPIERYGVSMNVAAIEAHALETGIIGVGEELTIQTKALAALDLLYQQTGGAQGQFAREADTTAGKLERLRAEATNVQAAFGEALIPAFEALIGLAPTLLAAIEDLGPAVRAMAEQFAAGAEGGVSFVEGLSDLPRGLGAVTDILGGLTGTVSNLGQAFLNLGDPSEFFRAVEEGGSAIEGMVANLQIRVGEQSLIGDLRDGVEPTTALANALAFLDRQGELTGDTLQRFAAIAGADLESDAFLGFLEQMGASAVFSADALDVLERAILDFQLAQQLARPGGGRGGLIPGTQEAIDDLQRLNPELFRVTQSAQDLAGVFNQVGADVALRDKFGDIPLVVSDIDVLLEALDRGGLAIGNFLTDAPEDVGIIGVFDDVETAVLETMATLETLPDELRAVADGFKSAFDVDVDAETGKISADTEAFKNDVIADFQEVTDFEFDLSQIAITGEAPNVAEFLREQGLSASELAEALLGNPADLAAAEEALSGSAEALAGSTAEDYAGFLRDLTPEQVASLGVFARENFVSPAILNQIADSAEGLMQALEDALSGTTLTPDFILSLTGAEIVGLPSFTAPVNIPDPINVPSGGGGEGGGTGTPPGVTNNFQVVSNINNPQTVDVSTAGAQATQNNMAIVGLLTNRPN